MSVATKAGSTLIRALHTIIDTSFLIILLLLLAFGCYAMWDSSQINTAASAERYEKYRPTAENGFSSFSTLQSINSDVYAWLTVYGTNIDYPLVFGDDNVKYVNTSAEGKYSLSGAIFSDSRNNLNFIDFNTILYGHHMDNNVMFGEIPNFSDKAYFDAHRYGKVFFDGQERGLEFFAYVHTNESDYEVFRANVTGADKQQEYIDMLMEKAIHVREDVPVSIDDRIVLLSTCSPNTTSGRDILIARLIDNVHENTFLNERAGNNGIIPTIDGLQSLWAQTALWIKIALAASLTLLIILLSYSLGRHIKNKKSSPSSPNT
jgi:sortase B